MATQYRIPPPLFTALISQESGFDVHAHNASGASGLTQLMPATAAGLGVHDVYNPHQNLAAGARYLRQQYDRFKSWRLALAAYNAGPGNVSNGQWKHFAETTHYVETILANAKLGTAAGAPVPMPKGPPTVKPVASTAPPAPGVAVASGPGGLFNDLTANQAFENLGRISRGTTPTFTLPDLVAAATQPAQAAPAAPPQAGSAGPVSPDVRPGARLTEPYRPSGKLGQVAVAAGANARGRRINPDVLAFIRVIAGVHGAPLTVTTGTNHNQYVAGTHRESRHWTGHAVDIAINHNQPGQVDPRLTKLGQDALIAAGVPPAQARQAHGGVYNLTRGGHRIQILFNTMEGGNHYTHLHVSVD